MGSVHTREVRVLSIRQPWAELILSGTKDTENRTWATQWRGRLVVHAGRRFDTSGALVVAGLGITVPRPAPTGYLGVADLVDVHPARGQCCEWGEAGGYHWRVVRPRRFEYPIPGPGRLGLHRPPEPVAAQLDTAIGALHEHQPASPHRIRPAGAAPGR